MRFSHPVDGSIDWNIFCEEPFKCQVRKIGRDIVPPLFPVFLLLRADKEGRQGRSRFSRVSIWTKSVVSSLAGVSVPILLTTTELATFKKRLNASRVSIEGGGPGGVKSLKG